MKKVSSCILVLLTGVFSSQMAQAACSDVTYAQLQTQANAVKTASNTGGFGLNMWVTMVDETGAVCHVVNTGEKGAKAGNSQWLGSRIISAQKANTANAFSLDNVSISTGALYAAVQPGGSLYGLQHSNPVNATFAYLGSPANYGRQNDPIRSQRLGGVNVFGGGIALYKAGKKVGAIGVSGDTSCTDHAFAWRVRQGLNLATTSPGGFETINLTDTFAALGDHPACFQSESLAGNTNFGFSAPTPPAQTNQ